MSDAVERALYPLDLVRQGALVSLQRTPGLASVLGARDSRVLLLMSLHALLAFLGAVLCPAFSLVVSPLVLGVPHIGADVRYMVVRLKAPGYWVTSVTLFIASMVALRVVQHATGASTAGLRTEHALGTAWLLTGACMGGRGGSLRNWRFVAILIGIATFAGAAVWQPRWFNLALTHGHNLIALAVWLTVFRARMLAVWPFCLAVLLTATWLASGEALSFTLTHGVPHAFGLHLFLAADWLAPGVFDPLGAGIVMSFAFLQNVHYAIWLYAIPQSTLRRDASLTFRMSYRALMRDFGGAGLALMAAIMLVVLVGAVVAPLATRNALLSVGTFHAWLELAVLTFLLSAASARRP